MSPVVVGLEVGGAARAWRAAGFDVVDDEMRMGGVRVRCDAASGGIAAWSLAGIDRDAYVDGLVTRAAAPSGGPAGRHPNGVVRIDHVVIATPDGDRTTHALAALGMVVRRVRDDARPGLRQTFLRADELIVEVVAPAEPPADRSAPARFLGIACTVRDLDECAALLGEHLSPVRAAVQPGRRIASLRHRDIGIPVPLAFMSE